VEIARLRPEHVRERFDSGVPLLDDFLRQFARQNDEKGLSRTYVATRTGELEVLGYVTLRVGEVACADLPPDVRKGLPRYPVPVLHLARLAVDKRVRGIGLGEALLMHALKKALDVADEVGLEGVEVIAKDEAARGFYMRYGFEPLVDDQQHLYLSVRTVRRAFP
jgi:GNAT superfamily N-acetyltransferase